jgi:acyl-CoA synthetase (AMP-forming)/AMP-acid ligase II
VNVPNALAARFAELRRARAGALAILDADGGRTLSRDDLARAADRVGDLLERAPVPARAVVAVQLANGPDFFAAVLACWQRDWVPMPVDHDVAAPALLELCRATGTSASLRAGADGGPAVAACGAGSEAPGLAREIALLKVTSGSTGEPRAVALTAEALAAGVAQIVSTMALEPADRNLVTIPLAHSYAFDNVVLTLLRDGMPAILARDLTPRRLLAVARDSGATVLPTVPFLIDVLGRSLAATGAPSLRRVISAGAPLPEKARERFAATFGVRPRTFYGATECGGIAFDREGSADLPDGCVGAPLDGVGVTLEDPDDDGIGRVRVRSSSVAPGYHPAPAPGVTPEQAGLGDGAFLTADLGRLDAQGRLHLVGRVHDVVNVGGRKVYPAEVERVIRAVPGVHDVAVTGVARSLVADALRAVVAAEPWVSREAIAAACEERLARYKVPRSIEIVAALPRTGRGKLDRRALDARQPND